MRHHFESVLPSCEQMRACLPAGVYSAPFQVEKVYPGGDYWNFDSKYANVTSLGDGWVLNPQDFSNSGASGEFIFSPNVDNSTQGGGFRVEIALACPACAKAFGFDALDETSPQNRFHPLAPEYAAAAPGLAAQLIQKPDPTINQGLNILNYDNMTNASAGPVAFIRNPDINMTCTNCYLQVQHINLYMTLVYEAAHNGFAEVATQVDAVFNTTLGVSAHYGNSQGYWRTSQNGFRDLVDNKILAQFNVFALSVAMKPVVTANLSQQSSLGWNSLSPMQVDTGRALLMSLRNHALSHFVRLHIGCCVSAPGKVFLRLLSTGTDSKPCGKQ